ncbi:penicillin acylase family protein [Hyphobacterium marinum]|uniref:Penicillin acylase family protein n=1 Tax=Hyphobacterium marinum TaxID=3116574 RepID=A0ABU7LYZ1_9PROT|nr:penicillin acylase family protein [Hyphobacterium sp. Y6023]MEE2566772.1 penicillin acylase family protein [Hyphobacterium sp. Y6023]
MMRWIVGGVAGLLGLAVVLVIAVSGWMTWRFYDTRPQVSGTVELAGISSDVSIVRDQYGVPHIFGETEADIFFALGYAHAQDRFFQMDMMRRYVHGRLSEVLGERTIRVDARNRIRGYHLVADAAVENLSPEARAAVEAYTAGVNARLERGTPSPEYAILRFSPEPWQPRDSAAVVVYMADSLAAGEYEEMNRRLLETLFTADQIAEFLPGYPDWAPTMLQAEDFPAPDGDVPAPETDVQDDVNGGSNAWVLSGEHTATGEPLLANDPHLGLSAPGIWYYAHLALPDGHVVGSTVAGAPLVVLGRNDVSAWGFTNTGFDVIDLRPVPPGSMATTERSEVIHVSGGDDVEITVQETESGPILDPDWFNLNGFGESDVILMSTALDRSNDVADVSYRIMKSRNWAEFVEAGRGYTAPMQNMHYAHIDGTIGYTTPGLVPLRAEDGSWSGFIPYEDLPRVENPLSGRIASGNNRIAPDNYPYPTPGEYSIFRAVRIDEMLNAVDQHDMASFHAGQMDVTSAQAQRLIPVIEASLPRTAAGEDARVHLAVWDGEMGMERSEPLLYALWYRELAREIYADELGENFRRFLGNRRGFIDNVLVGGQTHWCDDITTAAAETCADAVGAALDAAMAIGVERYGADLDAWNWGDVHQAVFDHPAFTGVPFLDGLFTVRQPVGGDGSTPNVAVYSIGADNFDVFHGPSLRVVYDLSDLDASRYMHAPGQSGHPLSPHYRDLAPMWAAGESFELRTDWTPESPPEGSRTLVLRPAG